MNNDYRSKIYARYASLFQGANSQFDVRAARLWAGPYKHYLRNWLPHSKAASIADIACGGGRLLQFFVDRGYANVCGVDVSEEQVALAQQVSQSVDQGDVIQWLLERPAAFELITCIDLIEHFDKTDVLRLLDACFVALKPNGRLVIQTPNAASIFGATVRYGDFTHEVCFTPNLLSRLLALCGFTDPDVREVGPILWGHSLASSVRAAFWRLLRYGIFAWNLVETGATGSKVHTRVFLISAIRPGDPF